MAARGPRHQEAGSQTAFHCQKTKPHQPPIALLLVIKPAPYPGVHGPRMSSSTMRYKTTCCPPLRQLAVAVAEQTAVLAPHRRHHHHKAHDHTKTDRQDGPSFACLLAAPRSRRGYGNRHQQRYKELVSRLADETQPPPDVTSTFVANPLRTDHVVRGEPTRTDIQDPATATTDIFANVIHKGGSSSRGGGGEGSGQNNGAASASRPWGVVGLAVAVVAGAMAFL